MKYKFLLLLVLLPITVFAQQSNIIYTDSVVMKSKQYLKGNDYQKDFLLFLNMLENTHPAFAMENPPLDIKKIRKVGYKELKKFNDSEKFALYLESIVSQLHDGHTYICCNYPSDTIFPMAFKYLNNEFFIQGVEEGNDEFIGKKILTINGLDMYDVMMSFGSLLSCDNDIFLIERFNCITKFCWKDSKYNTQEALTVTCDDGSSLNLNYLSAKEIKWKWVETKPLQSPYQKTQMPFRYEVYPKNGICYLQFSSCKDKNTLRFQFQARGFNDMTEEEFEEKIKDIPQFDMFLEEVFDTIKKLDIQTLVVDARSNSGGNSMLCDQLLSWLKPVDEIKSFDSQKRISKLMEANYPNAVGNLFTMNTDADKVFKGNVYFIQDNGTFSSAAMLIVMATDNNIGTVIGEAGSYRPCHFGDVLSYELPNTHVKGGVSHAYFMRPDKDACGENSLIPTIHIQRTWQDFIEGNDPWWQYILDNQ